MSRLGDLLQLRAFLDQEIARERQRSEPVTRDLVGAVAALYEVAEDFLADPDLRGRQITNARMAVCWLLRQRGHSTTQIGRLVGRDHTTVMHACRVVDSDPGRVSILRRLLDDDSPGEQTPGERLTSVVRAVS